MIACGDRQFDLQHQCLLMGVLNVTPDSFSDGGNYFKTADAVARAVQMLEDGADVIDIGGESTNPYVSHPVSAEEELERVLPVVKGLVKVGVRQISIDTRHAKTAKACLGEGASWVNDVSACQFDPDMINVVAQADALILMHSRDIPQKMQKGQIEYGNVVEDVAKYLAERAHVCVKAGINKSKIIVDPGIGFGKRLHHNIALLQNLTRFKNMAAGVLVGVSRKFFLGELTGIKEPANRDFATMGALAHAYLEKSSVLRVHNVKATREMLKVFEALRNSEVKNENLHEAR